MGRFTEMIVVNQVVAQVFKTIGSQILYTPLPTLRRKRLGIIHLLLKWSLRVVLNQKIITKAIGKNGFFLYNQSIRTCLERRNFSKTFQEKPASKLNILHGEDLLAIEKWRDDGKI